MKKTIFFLLFLIFSMCSGSNLNNSSLSDVEEVWCKSALSQVRNDKLWVELSTNFNENNISLDGYYLKYEFLRLSLTESMIKVSNLDESEDYKKYFGIPEDEDVRYLFLFNSSDNETIQENRVSLCKLWYQVNKSG